MLDLEQELRAVVAALNEHGIDYALCGGLALAVHGAPRATIDIDLLIEPNDYERVAEVVAPLGFRVVARPMSFSGGDMQIRRISKIDPFDGETLMLDLLLVTPATREAWSTRAKYAWQDVELSTVSRDGLIALKRFRSSEQDAADIRRLQELP